MQKRLFLALALSFLVLFVWQGFITKPKTTVTQPPVAETVPPASVAEPVAPVDTSDLTQYQLSSDLAEYILIDQNAAIKQVIFKKFKDYSFPLLNSLLMNNGAVFNQQAVNDNKVTYVFADEQKQITKELLFSDSSYEVKFRLVVENLSSQPLKYSFPLALGTLDLAKPASQQGANFQDVCVSMADKIVYPNIKKEDTFSSINFLSLRDHYFCAIIQPLSAKYSANLKKAGDKQIAVGLQSPEFDIPLGGKIEQDFRIFLGPQDLRILAAANPDWQSIVYFGKMDVIAHVLLNTLGFIQRVTHNWGFAIILVSILIYVLLYPLTLKQFRSMKEMQLVQPKVEALRCKYKDDPMRMQKEMMELYKEHKINPLGGCLPMLLQLPIFFSFYMVLSRSIELKGANFLWIKDLSEPDKIVVLPQALPFLGNEINLLPVLMVIASFFQQKFSSAQMSGTSAEQQKMMLYLFPLMFGVFFYHMPAGLVLYWFTNTLLTASQQTMIMKTK